MLFNSLQFHFIPVDGRPVRSSIPLQVLRGLFMNIIATVQPELATSIHDAGKLSEYSAQLKVDRENIMVTYNLFSKDLNEAVKDFILQRNDLKFNIGRLETLLVKVAVNRIDTGVFIDGARHVAKFKIVFASPTFFKSEGNVVLFPVPEILFKNIVHVWNELAGNFEKVEEGGLGDWAKQNIRVSSYQLETMNVDIGDGMRKNTGFRGTTTYIIKNLDESGEQPLLLDRLLRFAEYSNVGGARSTGLGKILYMPKYNS